MLNRSRALAFGVLTALVGAMGRIFGSRPEYFGRMTLGLLFVTIVGTYSGGDPGADAFANGTQRLAADGGDDFVLSRYTVDGGGGTSTGGGFTLFGTIGQPDAGLMGGGGFELRGGFGQPAAANEGCGDCPTDSDGNGDTEAFDLAILLGAWGPVTPDSACLDADENGLIEAFDLAVLLGAWGPCA